MKLSEDQRQSLITSLLGFVRRVSFHGAGSEEEAGAFFPIVNLLLGIPVALELNLDDLSVMQEEATESDGSQESENSGTCLARECGCRRCLVRKE